MTVSRVEILASY